LNISLLLVAAQAETLGEAAEALVVIVALCLAS
jgi:hypothetical protein